MATAVFPLFLVLLIYYSCLAYASVAILPVTIIETAIFLMLLLWFAEMAHKRNVSLLKTGFFLPLGLFLVFVTFTLLPLPAHLIKAISWHTASLYESFVPSGARSYFFPLSIYPDATIIELFKICAYAAILFLTINIIATKKQCNFLINAVILLGLLISVFGIIQKFTFMKEGKVYWFDPPATAAMPFGPFINRNNFSGYINMIIPLSLGVFLYSRSWLKKVIYGVSIWIMVLALFFTASRAGILICVLSVAFVLIVLGFKKREQIQTMPLIVFFSFIFIVSFFYVDFKDIINRFLTFFNRETLTAFGHGYCWRDILKICRDFPLVGTGLGTFASISSVYKSTKVQVLFTYAHNDYLQLLSETGLAGLICVLTFLFFYIKNFSQAWLSRHNKYVVYIGLGAAASIFSMLAYSLLDFNLHIPANAVLFFVILGLSYRLVMLRIENNEISR